jgi:hypothetical protein
MKKVLIAGLIAISAVGSAHAWGEREQGALAGIAGTLLYQHVTRPQVVYSQPQVVYQQQTYPQVDQQYEYRTAPQYTPQYQPPISCTPAYTQQGQYIGCIR